MTSHRLRNIIFVFTTLVYLLFSPAPSPTFADTGLCATPGKDGPGGILTGVVNTYYPGSASVPVDSTSIPVGVPVGAPSPISEGDLLLIIQMQDAEIDSANTGSYGDGTPGDPARGSTNLNNAGRYEYVVANGPVFGGVVPIRGASAGGGLIYAYTDADATPSQGQQRYQVIRIPQYSTASLSSTLTALQWNGRVGGILALDVAGQLTLGGTVSLDGLGFRGGGGRQLTGSPGLLNTDYRTTATASANGSKGEGNAGTTRYVYDAGIGSVVDLGVEGYPNGSMARGAPGNAGGGGTDGYPSSNDQNSGGGGGGNGGTGGEGGNTFYSNLSRGGFGGDAFPVAPSRFILGGGGGAGTRNNPAVSPAGSSGGAGGGIVLIRAGTVSGTGTITANGSAGIVAEFDGGGGGGAGGTIVFITASGSLVGLTTSARGGNGADAAPSAPALPINRHGPGGGGGGGVIFLSTAAASTDVSGGLNGTSTLLLDSFGATPGLPGITRSDVTAAELITGISGAGCLPILSTTNTTSTPFVVNTPAGTTAIYTISVSNAVGRGTAININIADPLPTGFSYASTGTVNLTGGATRSPTTTPSLGDTTPTWGVFALPGGGRIEVTFTVDIAASVADGTYQNPASAIYSDPVRSVPAGTISSNYDPGTSTGDDVSIGVTPTTLPTALPETGFAPGQITFLPTQHGASSYHTFGEMWLEIPKLQLTALIVGVPITDAGWDVSWLWRQAGYLEGTAFPTWSGNTALTGHVYLADGTPGPFLNIVQMQWGDSIIVHAHGQRHIYEVREVRFVRPGDLSVLRHESLPWVTLITCRNYDETKQVYNFRAVVRAVLIQVIDEIED